jgi:ketosteroid isomerase-like protein
MSQENVEVVAELARQFEQGDWDRVRAVFTEDARLQPPDGWPEAGPFFGRDAIVREFRRIQETWGTNRVAVAGLAEEEDRLVVQIDWSVEGATSGLPTQLTVFVAIQLDGQRISGYRAYWDRAEALEAAELSG